MSFTSGGSTRWTSPELLDPERFGVPESEGDRPTTQSDCYALGMVIYEVSPSIGKYVDAGTQLMPGIVRVRPIPRPRTRSCGHGGDRGGRSTE